MKVRGVYILAAIVIIALSHACATSRKLENIRANTMQALLVLPNDKEREFKEIKAAKKDTLEIVDFEGNKMFVMKVIQDENGENVATEQLEAAVVVARFRNIAERHGKVDLEFQVIVPDNMMDSKWQLRFDPDMYILGDTIRLDPVIITGQDYRKTQLRGYQRYDRFIKSIITDSTAFINKGALEIFLQRNIPQIYKFKNDSSFVSEEEFATVFGVSERTAIEHYTWKLRKNMNEQKKRRKSEMFHRFVKVPIVTQGIRLDTVIHTDCGNFVYNYVQTINTRPKLKKVDIVLSGEIYDADQKLYDVPETEPLTMYISSVSAFVDDTEKYMTKVIERKAEANTECHIEFPVGKSDIDEKLSDNATEIGRIKNNLRDLLGNVVFDLDSLTIEAYASPEGSQKANEALSTKRAQSTSKYFQNFVKHVQDSLAMDEGFSVIFDGENETIDKKKEKKAQIQFKSRSGGENWELFDKLVQNDQELDDDTRENYFRHRNNISDVDTRERSMMKENYYRRFREKYYPRLRVVKFNFYLHRKNMVKDTVHTTELDTAYMNALQMLKDHDYEAALRTLRYYGDLNAAVAYLALDRNTSAKLILETCERSAKVNYMLAIVYSREGDDQKAVQCYLHSCKQNPSYVNRGNLDPEISILIKRYGLNNQDDDEFDYPF